MAKTIVRINNETNKKENHVKHKVLNKLNDGTAFGLYSFS